MKIAAAERILAERSELTPSGCREWRLATGGSGYPVVKIEGKQYGAHRLACEMEHGPPPPGKPFALHHCDNPLCILGAHLYWGTQAENMRDRLERGRWAGGRRRRRPCMGHEFTPRSNGSCKHCRREYRLP